MDRKNWAQAYRLRDELRARPVSPNTRAILIIALRGSSMKVAVGGGIEVDVSKEQLRNAQSGGPCGFDICAECGSARHVHGISFIACRQFVPCEQGRCEVCIEAVRAAQISARVDTE
jgi:hypothetical protein